MSEYENGVFESEQQTQVSAASIVEELFVREDFSKPENRANVLLLAAASIRPFWDRLHIALDLKQETVLRPERNTDLGRPDLVARLAGERVALIECENWSENKDQSAAYAKANLPLILILGTEEEPERGTTWGRIREMLIEVHDLAEPRQQVILELLKGAIDDILGLKRKKAPTRISSVPEGWLKVATAPLLDLGDAVAGLHTVVEGSASVRLAKPNWAFRSNPRAGVFLVMSQRHRPDTVFLAGPGHLATHLSNHLQTWVANSWIKALREVTGGVFGEDKGGKVAVRTQGAAANPAVIAAALSELFALLRTGPGGPNSI